MKKLTMLCQQFRDQNLLLPIWFDEGKLWLIDQLKLPFAETVLEITTVAQLAQAIEKMNIRGSGAIGIAGAYGIYLSALINKGDLGKIKEDGELLKATRPTAINLTKTVNEILSVDFTKGDVLETIENLVIEILQRQLAFEHRLGEFGADVINDGDTILTHCHSGAMAGSGYGGRALSVIRKAFEQGKNIHVFTSETRPYLQGARITAYELGKFGIPHTLITDNMSGYLMQLGKIQKIVVGSDRVAANGDLINKIGTYMHAVAAKDNGVPFYTATSSHTIDLSLAKASDIKVEFRNMQEVLTLNGQRIAPADTKALYPSFDVTPNRLIAGIITERGVFAPSEIGKINL